MGTQSKRDLIKEGEQDYEQWRASLTDTPEKRALYQEIAAESARWLQRAQARHPVMANP